MTPEQVAASYDRIAEQWLDVSTYGFAQIERAVAFVKRKGVALDVGCGAGRCFDLLARHGFATDGIDLSPAMVALARDATPRPVLFHADICRWELPRSYDLIVAWDSVWHVPLDRQAAVLTKLCRGLAAGGVIVFTTGGTDAPDERRDSHMGPPMYHATLGIPKTLHVLAEAGCVCRHLEYDQYPEAHVYLIAQKPESGQPGDGRAAFGSVRSSRATCPACTRCNSTRSRTAWRSRSPAAGRRSTLIGRRCWTIRGTPPGPSCSTGRWSGTSPASRWTARITSGTGSTGRIGAGASPAGRCELLLREVAKRPLVATAATSNGASLRVLQKCGFVVEQVRHSPASDRYPECEEAVLVLR